MKTQWCWRCKRNVPMLDEQEFALLLSKMPSPNPEKFGDVLAEFERLTGYPETNVNAVWHHRIANHGPPCPRCGKVLRTPVAYKCFECGCVVHAPNWSFLFVLGATFEIPGRGVALVANRDAVENRLAPGDQIEIRFGSMTIAKARVVSIGLFSGVPAVSGQVGLLLSGNVQRQRLAPGQEVWLASAKPFDGA